MSKLETNTIDTISGSTNLTIGSTNSSTVTFESGAATGHMYPAFEATMSANQSLSDNVVAKIEFDTETFDTDSSYDNATNYRFTVPSGKDGKYCVYSNLHLKSDDDNQHIESFLNIYKNGSIVHSSYQNFSTNYPNGHTHTLVRVLNLTASDYIEIYGQCNVTTSTPIARAELNGAKVSAFGAYRIGA